MSEYEAYARLADIRRDSTGRQEFERIVAITDNVRYKDWALEASVQPGRSLINWTFMAACVNTGQVVRQYCRAWDVTGFDEEAIVKTAFAAAKMAEEHECAENFNYKGRRVFDPHRKVL